jgi:hypothetical protein
MTTEREFGNKTKVHLDRAAEALAPGTVYRLQLARRQALARAEPGGATVVDDRGGTRALAGGPRFGPLGSARFWLAVLGVVGALLYLHHWQVIEETQELGEIDAALLSADLPVDALLDRGFQNWLFRGDEP